MLTTGAMRLAVSRG